MNATRAIRGLDGWAIKPRGSNVGVWKDGKRIAGLRTVGQLHHFMRGQNG